MASLGPIRKCLNPTHKIKLEKTTEENEAPECKTDNGENAQMHEMNTYANAMHMVT